MIFSSFLIQKFPLKFPTTCISLNRVDEEAMELTVSFPVWFFYRATHHCLLPQIITPIAALYSGLRVINASVLLQTTAWVGFLFCSIATIILKSCVQLCNKKDASIKSGMGNGFREWQDEKHEKRMEDVMCFGALSLLYTLLHCINTCSICK